MYVCIYVCMYIYSDIELSYCVIYSGLDYLLNIRGRVRIIDWCFSRVPGTHCMKVTVKAVIYGDRLIWLRITQEYDE